MTFTEAWERACAIAAQVNDSFSLDAEAWRYAYERGARDSLVCKIWSTKYKAFFQGVTFDQALALYAARVATDLAEAAVLASLPAPDGTEMDQVGAVVLPFQPVDTGGSDH